LALSAPNYYLEAFFQLPCVVHARSLLPQNATPGKSVAPRKMMSWCCRNFYVVANISAKAGKTGGCHRPAIPTCLKRILRYPPGGPK
jgi:hypothetical protein